MLLCVHDDYFPAPAKIHFNLTVCVEMYYKNYWILRQLANVCKIIAIHTSLSLTLSSGV